MRINSFLLSILLHLALLAFVLYVPLRPPVDLNRPVYQVSLVMGAPGGEKLPSPVLGPRPPVTGKQVNSTDPAASPRPEEAQAPAPEAAAVPKPELLPKAEVPQPEKPKEPEPVKVPDPVNIPAKPEPKPEPKPEKKPEPKPEKKPEPKPEKKQEKKSEPKTESKSSKPKADPLAAALADARKQARSNSGKGGRGSSASRALADLEKQVGQTGVGGGGGEGDGPGGGGIYDVYAAQVILAVQPNWSMPTYSRVNMVVQVHIKLDKQGKVLSCDIERSSGRPEFDASAVNAVIRTGTLPPPPTAAQQDLVISFNSLEMAGR